MEAPKAKLGWLANAATVALVAAVQRASPAIASSLGAEPAAALTSWLQGQTTLLAPLLSGNMVTTALPWLAGAATTAAAHAPLEGVAKVAQTLLGSAGSTAATGAPWTASVLTQVSLAAVAVLFRIDRTAALLAYGVAAWLRAVVLGLSSVLPSTVAAALTVPPTFLAAWAISAVLLLLGTGTRPHGFSLHTAVHAGMVAGAVTAATLVLGPSGFGDAAGPLAAVGGHKLAELLLR
jgi:hypothetical protein